MRLGLVQTGLRGRKKDWGAADWGVCRRVGAEMEPGRGVLAVPGRRWAGAGSEDGSGAGGCWRCRVRNGALGTEAGSPVGGCNAGPEWMQKGICLSFSATFRHRCQVLRQAKKRGPRLPDGIGPLWLG